jgi:hypothetical protein
MLERVFTMNIVPSSEVNCMPMPAELRRMPREQRRAILAAAAALAEEDYLTDKELTGFDAFQEEELMTTNPKPLRGEVWRIRFDPAEGDEIKKIRTTSSKTMTKWSSGKAMCWPWWKIPTG